MALDHSESRFEQDFVEGLAGRKQPKSGGGSTVRDIHGQGGFQVSTSEMYDRVRCLLPNHLISFLISTQPKAWAKWNANLGDKAEARLLDRIAKAITERGTLDVLRKGIDGEGTHLNLVYFSPETDLNPEAARLVKANQFTFIRQLKYSQKNENSLDVVLFVNGLPVFTFELKNPLTGQQVGHAMAQYRKDRDPKEPLFKFKRCLAHFAMSPDEIFVTTELQGDKTFFLPVNRGNNHGAGNEPNPNGYAVSYLWEDWLQPSSILDLVQRYLFVEEIRDDEGRKTGEKLIFPRFHQRDAVRKLTNHARHYGPGQQYLIQHSAGSGKSNTIAWLAQRLSTLHDENNQKVFDTVLILTDRRALDKQLRDTVKAVAGSEGVVRTIEKEKSKELADALTGVLPSQIITVTIQTFPFAMAKMGERPDRRYAVVIDEAHSGQGGETNRHMRGALSVEGDGGFGDDDEGEDAINRTVEEAQRSRGRLANVSFFAFTATPKEKTLEMFGTKNADGGFDPFHLYSMKQAIEERFILDVLKNYTEYNLLFKLAKRIEDDNPENDPEFDKRKAVSLLRGYVRQHDLTMRMKARIIVDQVRNHTVRKIDGKGKAMVVCQSRIDAVKMGLAIRAEIGTQHADFKAMIAFSGEVILPDTGEVFTESKLNGVSEAETAKEFKKSEYRILVVAEKFQTGFDQPLLHSMFVDKILSNVNAVQTLSRLNRTAAGKDDTFVLDFVNDGDDIVKAFQPYFVSTQLTESTDYNQLYDKRRRALDGGFFTETDIEAFAREYFSETAKLERVYALLDPIIGRWIVLPPADKESTRSEVVDFVRLYAFLSQIITFTDVSLEKTYQFFRLLSKKMILDRERLPLEVLEAVDLDSLKLRFMSSGSLGLVDELGRLNPIEDHPHEGRPESEREALSAIVGYLNETYGAGTTDEDKIRIYKDQLEETVALQPGLSTGLDPGVNPAPETRDSIYAEFFNRALTESFATNSDMYKRMQDNPELRALMMQAIRQSIEARLFTPGT